MSHEPPPYSPRYIQAWSVLSIVLGLVLLGMFLLGPQLLPAGHIVWILIRWIFSPII